MKNASIILEYIKILSSAQKEYYHLLKTPVRSYLEHHIEFLLSISKGQGEDIQVGLGTEKDHCTDQGKGELRKDMSSCLL